ncbi:MAG TPA: hypothetical protein VGL39_24060 [Jatrophihabitantaceae bacterium]
MLFRGIADKKSAAAGGLAVVAGVAMSVLGAATSPARAAALGVNYTCSVGVTLVPPVQVPVPATMDVDIAGGVSGPVHVGDQVVLSGFQTVAHVSGALLASIAAVDATSISGHYDSFRVDARVGDAGQVQSATASMDISSSTPSVGGFDLIAPPGAIGLSGFTADRTGTMTFTAGTTASGTLDVQTRLGATQHWPFTCTRTSDASVIATATVSQKPKPPSSPPPSKTTTPGRAASAPAALSNASPSSETATGSSSSVNQRTAQHPQLARTGASYVGELTLGGGLLILAGAGLMYTARRRDVTALDT